MRLRATIGGRVALLAVAVLIGTTAVPGWAAESEETAYRYDPGGRRDPFVPLVRDGRIVAPQGSRLGHATPVLYGVLWDPEGTSIAMINDIEVKVGDRIGDYEVREIRHDAVVLQNGGEPVVLTITFDTPTSGFSPSATTGGR